MLNILEIFGICFIAELFLLVSMISLLIVKNWMDRKEKEKTYRHMLKYEDKLKNPKNNSTHKDKITDIRLTEINDRNGKKNELIYTDKDEKSFIEYRVTKFNFIDNKITRIISLEEENIIPNIIDENGNHIIFATIQITPINDKDEIKTVTIKIIINPNTGEYSNMSSSDISNIQISCVRKEKLSKEEIEENEINKKMSNSPEIINELLKNAVTEGYSENINSDVSENNTDK